MKSLGEGSNVGQKLGCARNPLEGIGTGTSLFRCCGDEGPSSYLDWCFILWMSLGIVSL